MAPKQWISIRNIIIYLETKFCPIGGFLYFGDHFGFKMAVIANQNIRHMVQHVVLPVISISIEIFSFLNLFLFFFIFILAAILKILKTKSTTLNDDLFCVKFKMDPLYGFRLTFIAPW